VLSLSRMNRVRGIDPVDLTMEIEAGVPLKAARMPRPMPAASCRSERLAGSVALVGEQAHAACAGTAMTDDAGGAGRSGRLGTLFPPQLLDPHSDRLEIVSCSRP
jgi:FAD/FMN-containing dehydrogenase